MDILSHGLWARAAASGVVEPSLKKKFNGWAVFFWGVFPDLFAFIIPFFIMFYSLAVGDMKWGDWPRPHETEPGEPGTLPQHTLALALYNYSHSLVIFALVVLLIYLIRRRIPWVMIGWPLHILCDIPTHSYKFFPTPVFWPLWGWKFDGISWGTPWFIVANYSALLIAYLIIRYRNSKKQNVSQNI